MVSFEKISAASQANSANSNHPGVDLISDALPFCRLWDAEPNTVSERNRLREVSQPLTRCRDSFMMNQAT
jgi:hypothetical protein